MCPFLNYLCQHWPCVFFIVPHPSLSFHWLICFSLLCICFNIASIFVFFCFFAPCFSACISSVALYQWLEADRQGRDPDIAATGKAPSMLLHLTVWMLQSTSWGKILWKGYANLPQLEKKIFRIQKTWHFTALLYGTDNNRKFLAHWRGNHL